MSGRPSGTLQKVVIIDDNPGDRELSLLALKKQFGTFEVVQPLDERAFQECLKGTPANLVITDYQLCWTDGLRILRDVRAAWPHACVVMVTGTGSEEIAVEAMKLGLDDYVIKTDQHRARLIPAVVGALDSREHKDALEQARAERERLFGIIDAATDVIWTANSTGILQFMNQAALKLLGFGSGESAAGLSIFKLHGDEDQETLRTGLNVAESAGIWNGELILKARSGEFIPVSIVIVAHRNVDGSVSYFSAIARDVRGWKNLEEQLRQSQKMDAIGQLAGGVAHDFNNNLTVILAGLQMVLRSETPLPSWQTDAIQAAMKAAENSVSLTRRLLSFSRRDAVKREPVDLSRLVMELTKMLRRIVRENIALRVFHPDEPVWVTADAGLLEQVIMNLVVNGRDAIDSSGTLTIEVEAPGPDERATEYPMAKVRVRDTGCGIPPDVRERIFEPFFTTKGRDKGTGLGLATVHAIVLQHGGRIDVESEVGIGSCFCLQLPICEPAVTTTNGSATRRTLAGGNETILLIEDDKRVIALVEAALAHVGYRILQASSADDAHKIWASQQSEIDLVLSDAVLPGVESGLDFLKSICDQKTDLEVVLMSGYSTDAIKAFIAEEPHATFLEKPFTLEELMLLVRERLDHVG